MNSNYHRVISYLLSFRIKFLTMIRQIVLIRIINLPTILPNIFKMPWKLLLNSLLLNSIRKSSFHLVRGLRLTGLNNLDLLRIVAWITWVASWFILMVISSHRKIDRLVISICLIIFIIKNDYKLTSGFNKM